MTAPPTPPSGSPRFTRINVAFSCEACGRPVAPLPGGGCRNHCPFCLTSRHVDLNPGDRANPCGGLMRAFDYELNGKKGLVLLFRCEKCGGITRNIAAHEAAVDPDNYELILALKAPPARG